MTRRDYVAIAGVIQAGLVSAPATGSVEARAALIEASHRISDVCKEDNDRFNEDQFLRACGVRN